MLRQWSKPCTILVSPPDSVNARTYAANYAQTLDERSNMRTLALLSFYLFLASQQIENTRRGSSDIWLLGWKVWREKRISHGSWLNVKQHLERGTKGHHSFISETRGYFTIHCLVTSQINQWTQNVPLLVLQPFSNMLVHYNLDLNAHSAVDADTADIALLKGQILWWDHIKNERVRALV